MRKILAAALAAQAAVPASACSGWRAPSEHP